MKLYELDWALYPRRISIYLAEKGITGIERIAFDVLTEWPAPKVAQLSPMNSVPILETDEGGIIRSSTAILEYLEERFSTPDMIGSTPVERARVRDVVNVVDEAAMHFAIWNRQGSPLFAGRGQQNPIVGAFAGRAYLDRLRVLDKLIDETGEQFACGPQPTIADCIMMATVQFAANVYAVPLPESCPNLARWHEGFAQRPSATPPTYPAPILQLARGLPAHCPPASS